MKKSMCVIDGVWGLTTFCWNKIELIGMSYPSGKDKFVTQQAELNIRIGCAITTDFPCAAGRDPNLLCLTSHSVSWAFLPCCTYRFFRTNRCVKFTSLCTFIIHASCSFRLYSNTVNFISRWCNTNKNLSMVLALRRRQEPPEQYKVSITNTFWSIICDAILLLSPALPTTGNKFPRHVEWSMKFSYTVELGYNVIKGT
jgi:hypothetical protein